MVNRVATNSERIDANTDAIRKLETAVEVQAERLANLDRKLTSLGQQFDWLRDQLQVLQGGAAAQREVLARHDERLKQIEQRLERRWNLLLVLAGAAAGMVFAFLGNLIAKLVLPGI
jgi:septal ring factor EnvC (AmiA/AmiB activator)